ncbi:acyl-homoserine-lactone synthase [Mesorhizobium sp. M00.F.Ca.ET.216.01.1.1]|uniref:acyl-homoserine-lactone synthase n=1 Tax=Mesorhizobium sp. M00.F.Ca.ET.216.01.1.1 TaxID=2500528 RepID=UPI000FDC713E|nr:acyl-homoserine-lactone synthase [Mesorhizobium sp. M00.F.Ca.ET.216.01.1.1]TGQ28079.1 N-acyl-L-homoserine lactone (AHL) synthase [Mesorhizobium sp. M00.F.Ca.ET.216.01.1.1]TJW07028.1 MAG: N-acyl-L-homoserine lactone (AHL) synthase [Mesorhizobium sp.]
MITVIQPHHYRQHRGLLDQMFRLRKRVFFDQLDWEVPVHGDWERDAYDDFGPAYLVWTDGRYKALYGAIRLLPTTGPTLLYDVFRRTFPEQIDLAAPGIWEGTRMCIDEALLARDHPTIDPGRAFCLMLLALCEVALAHGIHTMVSNYEPHLKRVYQKAGAALDEIGRADGYGKRPVCCGVFEVSERILGAMREKLDIAEPLYPRHDCQLPRRGWGALKERVAEAVAI